MLLALAILCAVDFMVFKGEHAQTAWHEAKNYAQQLVSDFDYQLKKIGLR